jgi:hypothetical protein
MGESSIFYSTRTEQMAGCGAVHFQRNLTRMPTPRRVRLLRRSAPRKDSWGSSDLTIELAHASPLTWGRRGKKLWTTKATRTTPQTRLTPISTSRRRRPMATMSPAGPGSSGVGCSSSSLPLSYSAWSCHTSCGSSETRAWSRTVAKGPLEPEKSLESPSLERPCSGCTHAPWL